jgi:hypothetical protein
LTDLRQYRRYLKQPPDTQPPIDVKFDVKVRVVEPKIIEVSGTVDLGTYYDEQMQKTGLPPRARGRGAARRGLQVLHPAHR